MELAEAVLPAPEQDRPCPHCSRPLLAQSPSCGNCGLIPEKWKALQAQRLAAYIEAQVAKREPSERVSIKSHPPRP